ncbi:MAG: FHA domain-containing protein [Actinomycetota bacterium]|nr:FHA domain-containing protein [Actinomycetota bacterium]
MTDFDASAVSPADLVARAEAEDTGMPFVVYLDAARQQHVVVLPVRGGGVTIGRRDDNDIALVWDPNVSRVHAQLEPVGGEWVIVDDGLSRHGSAVNGRRLARRQRLQDRDVVTVGMTDLLYRSPPDPAGSTAAGRLEQPPPHLTDTQRRVLVALCRPCLEPDVLAPPATNRQIADEVFLSVDAVKAHLRGLFAKFEVGDLAHNEKRIKLVGEAIRHRAVTHSSP